MRTIKGALEPLPLGMGRRVLIPVARAILSLSLIQWVRCELEAKIRQPYYERKVVRQIISKLGYLKQVIVVVDNKCTNPVYGVFLYFVFIARFFIARNIRVIFVVIDGEYHRKWPQYLKSENISWFVAEQKKLAETFLGKTLCEVKVVSWVEAQEYLQSTATKSGWEYYVFCADRVMKRKPIQTYAFNICNQLNAPSNGFGTKGFLLESSEFEPHLASPMPTQPYITWNCRYNENWSPERNTSEGEFVDSYHYLSRRFPGLGIMVVSDSQGCGMFKMYSERHSLPCLFSKDYSGSFIGDVYLILSSKFFYQVRGGGMAVIPEFSLIPYEIKQGLSVARMWCPPGQFTAWQTQEQTYIHDPLHV